MITLVLLIVNTFGPAVLLKEHESLLHSIESCASRARIECEWSACECELVGGRHCSSLWLLLHESNNGFQTIANM